MREREKERRMGGERESERQTDRQRERERGYRERNSEREKLESRTMLQGPTQRISNNFANEQLCFCKLHLHTQAAAPLQGHEHNVGGSDKSLYNWVCIFSLCPQVDQTVKRHALSVLTVEVEMEISQCLCLPTQHSQSLSNLITTFQWNLQNKSKCSVFCCAPRI